MAILLSLSGFPGYGKTTQCRLLEQYYQERITVLSVPMIFRMDEGLIEYLNIEDIEIIKNNLEDAKENMRKGILIDKYADEILYKIAEVALKKKDIVVLDGSPRDGYSLRLFDKLCRGGNVEQGIVVQLVSYTFNDNIELSISRQRNREKQAKRDICTSQLRNKSKVYFEYMQEYLNAYLQKESSYVRYYEINCDNKVEDVQEQIRDCVKKVLG